MAAEARHLGVAVLLWALLGLPGQVGAQVTDPLDAMLGKTVGAVKIMIEDRPVDSEQLVALLDIKPGDILRLENLRRTSDRFASDPRFENVQVLAVETPAGLEVTFRLIPRHPVDDIEILGDSGLSPAELERLVREQYGGLPTNVRMRDLEDTVEQLLQGEGFRTPAAVARIVETHNPDRATLVFQVDAGPRTIIRSVNIEGRSPYSRETIAQRTGAQNGAPFRERAIATALVKIRDELRDRRFYAAIATYTPPPLEGTVVDLTLRVEAGPEVELRVEPEDHLPKGGIDQHIPVRFQSIVPSGLMEMLRIGNQMAASGRDILFFAQGEPDFDTPPHIKQAAAEFLSGSPTRYAPAPSGVSTTSPLRMPLATVHSAPQASPAPIFVFSGCVVR